MKSESFQIFFIGILFHIKAFLTKRSIEMQELKVLDRYQKKFKKTADKIIYNN